MTLNCKQYTIISTTNKHQKDKKKNNLLTSISESSIFNLVRSFVTMPFCESRGKIPLLQQHKVCYQMMFMRKTRTCHSGISQQILLGVILCHFQTLQTRPTHFVLSTYFICKEFKLCREVKEKCTKKQYFCFIHIWIL